MSNPQNAVAETFQQVIMKCWQDEAYKARLVANPVAAIREINPDFSIVEGKTLVVRDQTDSSTLYINVPPMVDTDDVELSEKELEAVAGGAMSAPRRRVLIDRFKHSFIVGSAGLNR